MSQRFDLYRRPITRHPIAVLGAIVLLLPILGSPLMAEEVEELDPGLVAVGKSLARTYCASCHGREGKGDGPVAESLSVEPADLTRIARRNDGVFPGETMRKVIDGRVKVRGHGSAEMPVWGDVFQKLNPEGGEDKVERKLGALIEYLRSIQVDEDDEDGP